MESYSVKARRIRASKKPRKVSGTFSPPLCGTGIFSERRLSASAFSAQPKNP